jgi:hypothetical protein
MWMEEVDKPTKRATDSKETEIHLSVTAAELCRSLNDNDGAEKQYLRALELTREYYDHYDARVGSILMELLELYELQGRSEDVLRIEREIADISRRYFFQYLARATKLKRE